MSGSLSRAGSTGRLAATRAAMGSLTSHTLTFMPATGTPASSQKTMTSRVFRIAPVDHLVPVCGVAVVLHAEVVLVGEEVGDLPVLDLLAEHVLGRNRALIECRGPVLEADLGVEDGVEGVGHVAGGPDPRCTRGQVLVDDDAVVDGRGRQLRPARSSG